MEMLSRIPGGIKKGLSLILVFGSICLFLMLGSDLSLNSTGRYENSADSSQWIEFKSGNFSSGTASFYTPANAARTQFQQEIVEYQREGRRISFHTAVGLQIFEVQGNKLIDSTGVTWVRKYSTD